ncbi:hypothetical protein [Mucilaginibacter hurinus]|nr:hypothetical protein [Mucilaginibacter hurinus]
MDTEVEGLLTRLTENTILPERMSNEAYITHLNIAQNNIFIAS